MTDFSDLPNQRWRDDTLPIDAAAMKAQGELGRAEAVAGEVARLHMGALAGLAAMINNQYGGMGWVGRHRAPRHGAHRRRPQDSVQQPQAPEQSTDEPKLRLFTLEELGHMESPFPGGAFTLEELGLNNDETGSSEQH